MRGSIVYIGTTNDTSGNPRRGWILGYGTADATFVDEGYSGTGALVEHGLTRADGDLPKIDVTPGEYRYWLKRSAS